ncbi:MULTISPECIES: hypothetical protein [unclassified Chelatococcus]|uniref:hypothetical protein n=1 Tax=unclassified Chelatococcus TaxID=2638111 RepID=UPI001BD08C9C|nr:MULTISPECIES: hypothetical protein [unclassified Chelatococcus]CAH1654863.1 hypothetical protein CHELA41_20977 [Hyphomicrobiales bacterium]MBS7740307.1 hypothetical protein [Chelatococcus sp. HY11]MBX3544863.1 hypothetical protein [Chelatococcus sp.]MCO5078452.1 hypothetical protein [Chelatococcus sp.]CAH1685288.1 hypothetical protein CHELA20_53950 [Hyphomicrobiales bacterium]
MSSFQRPPTRHESVIWRNVEVRFPGFTDKLANFYWGLIDEMKVEAGTPQFAQMLLGKFPEGIDTTDLATDNTAGEPRLSHDPAAIGVWAASVHAFYGYIESVLGGSELIPCNTNDGWTSAEQIRILQHKNAELSRQVADLKAAISQYEAPEGETNKKRMSSFYKLIYTTILVEYKFEQHRLNAIREIKKIAKRNAKTYKSFEHNYKDLYLDDDVFSGILDEAYENVKGTPL